MSFNVSERADEAPQLEIARIWLPLHGGIAGVLLLLLGAWFIWRGQRSQGRRVA